MDDTVRCPGCEASLTLPYTAAGQTVQCPRCQRVFEPRPQVFVGSGRLSSAQSASVVETDDIHDDVSPLPVSSVRPPRDKYTTGFLFLLGVCIVSYAVQLYVNCEQSTVVKLEREKSELALEDMVRLNLIQLNAADVRRINEIEKELAHLRRLTISARIFHHFIFWPTMLAFLCWFYAAYQSLSSLRTAALVSTPVLASSSFFIPAINLFLPLHVMQEIWQASDPQFVETSRSWEHAPRSWAARFWWVSLVIGLFLSFVATCIGMRSAKTLDAEWIIAVTSNVCMIIAGIFLIFIVRTITARQRERFARLYGVATA